MISKFPKFAKLLLRRPLFLTIRKFANSTDNSSEVFFEHLHAENEKGIYVLNLNRQKAKNALNFNVINELAENIRKLKTINDLKVLILASKVRGVFCAGADLKERIKMDEKDLDPFVANLRSVAYEIYRFPKPTIASIDGVAVGGGLEMALACDMRICSSDSRMGLVETSLAILPGAFGSQLLPRIVGPAFAKELIFTAKIINANQAAKICLVNDVKEQNEDKNAALLGSIDLAKKILPNGPIAIQAVKTAINDGLDAVIKDCLEIERNAYRKVIPTKDRIEGLKAFIEKRKPVYKGE